MLNNNLGGNIMEKKHLIYAEDLVNEILQYPSRDLSKKLIRQCAKKVIKEKTVPEPRAFSWHCIKNLFSK